MEYVKLLGMTEADLARRREFFRITDADLELLRRSKPFAEGQTEGIVEEFYDHLMSHSETREYLADGKLVERLKKTQTRYFLELFDGVVDMSYCENRLRIGGVHERLGIPPRWYMGAYSRYLRLVHQALVEQHGEGDQVHELYSALEKLMHFDAALAIDAYIAANVQTVTRQQTAIRELSTPVIRIHDECLLMPLVGTIDSHRAQQIMEGVLRAVADQQARVLILDIAGVAVVDTQVADYLLKATAAVRLLGATTILTGISPQVARTIVELGVDISAMYTRNRLSDGLELALAMVGKQIAPRKAK